MNCINCNKSLGKRQYKFCSVECNSKFRVREKDRIMKSRLEEGLLTDELARFWFRKFNDKVCSICGLSSWNGLDIPLVVDHINGNHLDNRLLNLRFVCCNCDAQLPTYKAKNKGKGRCWR